MRQAVIEQDSDIPPVQLPSTCIVVYVTI